MPASGERLLTAAGDAMAFAATHAAQRQLLELATGAQLRAILGIPSYVDRPTANAALELGQIFFNTTSNAYETATA